MNWIDIALQQPQHQQKVLITNGTMVSAAQADTKFYEDNRIWWDGCEFGGYEWEWDFDTATITHWMPLPTPPSD
jgi:hypothetical protein